MANHEVTSYRKFIYKQCIKQKKRTHFTVVGGLVCNFLFRVRSLFFLTSPDTTIEPMLTCTHSHGVNLFSKLIGYFSFFLFQHRMWPAQLCYWAMRPHKVTHDRCHDRTSIQHVVWGKSAYMISPIIEINAKWRWFSFALMMRPQKYNKSPF